MILIKELEKVIKVPHGTIEIIAEKVYQENKKLYHLAQVSTMLTKWTYSQYINTNQVVYLFQRLPEIKKVNYLRSLNQFSITIMLKIWMIFLKMKMMKDLHQVQVPTIILTKVLHFKLKMFLKDYNSLVQL